MASIPPSTSAPEEWDPEGLLPHQLAYGQPQPPLPQGVEGRSEAAGPALPEETATTESRRCIPPAAPQLAQSWLLEAERASSLSSAAPQEGQAYS